MPPPSSPYRNGRDAVNARLAAVRARLLEVDGQLALHGGALPPTLRKKLTALRATAEPQSETAQDTICGERSVGALELDLDEALGLAAELQRAVDPVLPAPIAIARWAAMTLASVTLLILVVAQLGLGDFMLQAFGVKVLRANATLPCDRFAFEAQRAAGSGHAPQHAQWVDPSP